MKNSGRQFLSFPRYAWLIKRSVHWTMPAVKPPNSSSIQLVHYLIQPSSWFRWLASCALFARRGHSKPGRVQDGFLEFSGQPNSISPHLKLVTTRQAGFRYLVALLEQIPVCGKRSAGWTFPGGRPQMPLTFGEKFEIEWGVFTSPGRAV
jgi:hypothetical protein